MLVSVSGIPIRHSGSCPAYGTVLSSSCEYWSGYDANNNYHSGYYLNHRVLADGYCGSFSDYGNDRDGCWYPSGFYFSYQSGDNVLSWTGCSSSGQFYWGDSASWTAADGNGGSVSNGSSNDFYGTGYVIYDNGYDCRVVYTGGGNYTTENYGGSSYDSYGYKYGTPFWDSNQMGLMQNIADGIGGSLNVSWDNSPPYPVYGTQTASANYFNGATDAVGTYWSNQQMMTNYYADGTGGQLSSNDPNGYYDYGFALTAPYIVSGNYYSSSVYDDNAQLVYLWGWFISKADGYGGSLTVDASTSPYPYNYPPYGTQQSDGFYLSGTYGNLYADGMANYYFG